MSKLFKILCTILSFVMLVSCLSYYVNAQTKNVEIIDLGNGSVIIAEYDYDKTTPIPRVYLRNFDVDVVAKNSKTLLATNINMSGQTNIVIEFDSVQPEPDLIYFALYDDTMGEYVLCDDGDFLSPVSGSFSRMTITALNPAHVYSLYAAGDIAFSASGRVYTS